LDGKIVIQKGQWENLRGHHRLVLVAEHIELTTFKIKINEKKCKESYVIQIGKAYSNLPRNYGSQKKGNHSPHQHISIALARISSINSSCNWTHSNGDIVQ
jgi:hypothetical protein